jgi:CheY-like chemotaxis protein
MGLALSERPVVLIVEDEFLLRMDAVEIIAGAGFEVVEAADADQAIEILLSPRYHGGLHRHPDAGIDGWVEACPGNSWSLAAD